MPGVTGGVSRNRGRSQELWAAGRGGEERRAEWAISGVQVRSATLRQLGMEAQEAEALRACTVILGLESQVTQLHKKTACVKTTVVILAGLRHMSDFTGRGRPRPGKAGSLNFRQHSDDLGIS